jgi:hypothetical protein
VFKALGCTYPGDRPLSVKQDIAILMPKRLLRQVILEVMDIGLRQYCATITKKTDFGRILESHGSERAVGKFVYS